MSYCTLILAPGMISTTRDPRYMVIWNSTKSLILSFQAVFMGYSTRFLAPGTVSMARDPRYTVIWKSKKLVNFVIFGHFHELLHTAFGSGDGFNGL